MPSQIVMDCSKMLSNKKWRVAFAESATAGRMAAEFSLTPDSGKILLGGLVCYDADLKQSLLGVSKELIEKYTPESAEVSKAIAEGLSQRLPGEVFVGVTGLTTPGGSETPEKPVGTIFLHLIVQGRHIPIRKEMKGEAEQIVMQAVDAAAAGILEAMR